MKAAEKISQKLENYTKRKDDLKIKDWRFGLAEGCEISLGLDKGEIGGPYLPPSTNDVFQGSAYVIWADDSVSIIDMDAKSLEDLDLVLKEGKLSSYVDPDSPDILEPQTLPSDLKIKDEKVADLINKDNSYFFEVLEFYKDQLGQKPYAKNIEAEVGASLAKSNLMNSKGLNVSWESTSMSTGAIVNDKFWDFYSKRNLCEKKDLNRIVNEIDRFMMHIDNPMKMKSGKMKVILAPDTLGAFFGKYIAGEILEGGSIAENQSLYTVEDFLNKRKIFDERINLVVNGLKDYDNGTVPCSGEGVPATKQYLIAEGRLITPMLGLKYAKKIGMEPTPPGSLKLEVADKMPYSGMLKGIDYGLIVYGVLGMHTQDSKTGRYGLAVSEGLLVEDGKVKGTVKDVVIAGNFFDALNDKKTKFAKYRADEIAMRLESTVKARD
ncbi:MAG: hypothetical protein KKA79_04710 [Nanoarchaeota archaeon]|nr:hypothetical protein [Nanoarchaeota archaeon]MCG2717369.1 metallopeptidase TldD-related protein [Nanoarchaeota archaeon]